MIDFLKYIKKIYSTNEIKFVERYPFFQFKDYSTSIYIDNVLIATIYKNYNVCIPFIKVNDISYCSFHYNLLFLYSQVFFYKCFAKEFKDKKLQIMREYEKLAGHILYFRNSYLKYNKLNCLSATIFEDFFTNCKGDVMLAKEIKKEAKQQPFRYVPIVKYLEHLKCSYSNQSGRIIMSNALRKINIAEV